MTSRRTTGRTCRSCGRTEAQGYEISARRLCNECGDRALTENIAQMTARDGPNWSKWALGILAGVERATGVDAPRRRRANA